MKSSDIATVISQYLILFWLLSVPSKLGVGA